MNSDGRRYHLLRHRNGHDMGGSPHRHMKGNMEFSRLRHLATMANGLPYSPAQPSPIRGRQIVYRRRRGFSMLMSELATLVKHACP